MKSVRNLEMNFQDVGNSLRGTCGGARKEAQCSRRECSQVWEPASRALSWLRGSGRQKGAREERRTGVPSFLVSSGDLKLDYKPLECREGEREFGDKGD